MAIRIYGGDPTLRQMLQDRGIGYVLAIACNLKLSTTTGAVRVDELAAVLARHAWVRASAGTGAKRHQNENVIDQGLFYLDWLMDHRGEFQLLVQ